MAEAECSLLSKLKKISRVRDIRLPKPLFHAQKIG